jgi:hypothetical protein
MADRDNENDVNSNEGRGGRPDSLKAEEAQGRGSGQIKGSQVEGNPGSAGAGGSGGQGGGSQGGGGQGNLKGE